jgi:hypothetical protein
MKTNTRNHLVVFALVAFVALLASDARAQQVQCSSPAGKVTAVTKPTGHVITAKYQAEKTPMQTLLKTKIATAGDGCLIAHLSGQVRITDNYVAFQVRVDGVPLEGQLPLPLYTRPVVFVAIDSSTANDDEQFIDPTKPVSFNMFTSLPSGVHVVEVLGAAGSGIATDNPPTATHLVLTLEYR